jgi:hypothetical protein
MKLSTIKNHLSNLETVNFQLQNGTMVPAHFHVTEVGIITKKFIDCGGIVREENIANFQLWDASDFDHRLKPSKLLNIIALSENILGIQDLEVEVEYQSETIGKYDIDFDGTNFLLLNKTTDCLAKDKCGIPAEKLKVKMADLVMENSCKPGGGCC